MRRASRLYGLRTNPVSGVERLREPTNPELDVLEPEEVWALVRAARNEQDAAMFLTAAFTGLRMGELRALRWRDVDFPRAILRVYGSYCNGNLTTPKNGKARSVPLARDVASALARLAQNRCVLPTTTSCSPGTSANSSTTPHFAADTRRRSPTPACASCASTTCATRSARG